MLYLSGTAGVSSDSFRDLLQPFSSADTAEPSQSQLLGLVGVNIAATTGLPWHSLKNTLHCTIHIPLVFRVWDPWRAGSWAHCWKKQPGFPRTRIWPASHSAKHWQHRQEYARVIFTSKGLTSCLLHIQRFILCWRKPWTWVLWEPPTSPASP